KRVTTGSSPPAMRQSSPSHHTTAEPPVAPTLTSGNAANNSSSATVSVTSLSMFPPHRMRARMIVPMPVSTATMIVQGMVWRRTALLAFDAGDAGAEHDVGRGNRVAIGAAAGLRRDDRLLRQAVQLGDPALHAAEQDVRRRAARRHEGAESSDDAGDAGI